MAEKTSLPKNFIAGGFSGTCAIVVGQPLDMVKVQLQTQPKPELGRKPLYSGSWDCALKILRNEGFFGFYKGMSAPLMAVSPMSAMGFVGFNIGKKLQQKDPDEVLTPTQLMVAGMFAGTVRSVITTPGDRIKVLLQVQICGMNPRLYNGPVHAAKVLYKEGGIFTFYRGMGITLLRDTPGIGAFYMSYELIRRALTPGGKEKDLGTLQIIIAGGMAGVISWLINYPADVIKSRLQGAPEGKYPKGMRSVWTELLRKEGPRALYKGTAPVVIRAFPANAALFLGYETAMEFMNWIVPGL